MPTPAIMVYRREPHVGPTRTAAERNVRPLEDVHAQRSPDPIRYGDTPARPARMPIVTFLSIASIKAVMRDEFRYSIIAPWFHAATPGVGPTDTTGRGNVGRGAAYSFGDLVDATAPQLNG